MSGPSPGSEVMPVGRVRFGYPAVTVGIVTPQCLNQSLPAGVSNVMLSWSAMIANTVSTYV